MFMHSTIRDCCSGQFGAAQFPWDWEDNVDENTIPPIEPKPEVWGFDGIDHKFDVGDYDPPDEYFVEGPLRLTPEDKYREMAKRGGCDVPDHVTGPDPAHIPFWVWECDEPDLAHIPFWEGRDVELARRFQCKVEAWMLRFRPVREYGRRDYLEPHQVDGRRHHLPLPRDRWTPVRQTCGYQRDGWHLMQWHQGH